MLPYPNPHHHFGVSQEPPNPTAGFPMLPPAAAHLDHHHHHHHYVVDHFFPGHGHHHFNSETLEAVLRPPRSAHPESEAAAVVTAPPPPPPGAGRNAGGGQAGHARARKRPFRTDRHSKIRTAQGVRDRRMRLSLDVARDFFALQDRLGFDKASKTVDWLLTQSKPAIDRLTDDDPSSHQRSGGGGGGGDVALSPPTSGAPASHGSGKRGDVVEMGITRNGVSAFMEHSSCELDRLVSAVAPAIGAEYYYAGLGEMMSNSGGDQGDEDGEYEEDGDDEFLDGMQY